MRRLVQSVILFLSFLCLSISGVFSAEDLWDVTLKNATSNTIEFQWPAVEGSFWYYVSYWLKSWIDGSYESEYDDLLDSPILNLTWLEANTKYYISIISVDENWDEIAKSKEVEFNTLKEWEVQESIKDEPQQKALSFNQAEIISYNNVELVFDTDIDPKWELDFILKWLTTPWEIVVNDIKVNENKVMLRIDWKFETDKQYELVIISIYGVKGETITSWIDGAIKFWAPDMTIFDPKIEETNIEKVKNNKDESNENMDWESASTESIDTNQEMTQEDEEIKELESMKDTVTVEMKDPESAPTLDKDNWLIDESEEIELNAPELQDPKEALKKWIEVEKITKAGDSNVGKSDANLAGTEIPDEDLANHTTVVAKDSDNLPTTWPESILLILWSLLVAFFLFYISKWRKS